MDEIVVWRLGSVLASTTRINGINEIRRLKDLYCVQLTSRLFLAIACILFCIVDSFCPPYDIYLPICGIWMWDVGIRYDNMENLYDCIHFELHLINPPKF